jgi:hypothetical protein
MTICRRPVADMRVSFWSNSPVGPWASATVSLPSALGEVQTYLSRLHPSASYRAAVANPAEGTDCSSKRKGKLGPGRRIGVNHRGRLFTIPTQCDEPMIRQRPH